MMKMNQKLSMTYGKLLVFLCSSGEALGPFWDSWGFFGGSWVDLGGPLGVLVGSLASTLGPWVAERELRAKKKAKSLSVSNHLDVPKTLFCYFWLPWVPPGDPFWPQGGHKGGRTSAFLEDAKVRATFFFYNAKRTFGDLKTKPRN